MSSETNVSAKEKSILDRCTYDVYREYVANNYEGEIPTLKDLYHSLLKQPEPEARGLALSSELFITGSLNTFAQRTNVDTKDTCPSDIKWKRGKSSRILTRDLWCRLSFQNILKGLPFQHSPNMPIHRSHATKQ